MNITDICREAWNATKKEHQPSYDELSETYRGILAQRAAGGMNGQITDGPFASFESYVYAQTRPKTVELERVVDEPETGSSPEAKLKPKKTAKKLAATKTAAKQAVKVIKKPAKKGKK